VAPSESGDQDSRSTTRTFRLKIAELLEVAGQPPPTPTPEMARLEQKGGKQAAEGGLAKATELLKRTVKL
jgi:hypothetical protein